ncbi:hypothetical protein CONPUDRAFT_138534 [Coniophora puteana RWD-64-598 SS2]|uniref:Uncharacterized protein n=1 Tax=Coniophora puteana (strain RWD-64-598) TaxID=741705 RepID=A0A5M3MK40_CONPW|nr:uncharacterized protein CONPUDRAFT_138534 [Coniophora puteana RWD-64-598 SS2]EIW79426.1 hypothetical protein CONPUDRAFT_138534 [Coniophora puteana RWD-64-598 SS2]
MKKPSEAMINWLWDRTTALHSLIPLTDMSAPPPAYISLIYFAWHTDWDGSDPLPTVQNPYRRLRRELLLAKDSYCHAHETHQPIGPVATELRTDLEFILAACAQARCQSEDAANKGTHITCDFVWDTLIAKLLHDQTFQVRHAAVIALPRSTTADRYEEPKWHYCARYTVGQHKIYVGKFRDAAELVPYARSPLATQALDASATLTRSPGPGPRDHVHEAILDRASRDPVEAICDAVATVSLPGFVDSTASPALRHAARSFGLMPASLLAPATAIARGETPFYHGICDLPSTHERLASAYDLFCANIPSAGLVAETDGFLNLDMSSFSSVPDSALEKKQVPCLACVPPSAQSLNSTVDCDAAAPYCTPVSEDPLALDLPLLFVNHTPPEKVLSYVGCHKHRLSATTGAAFLGAAGLDRVPVFSLVTDGCRGVITCAWSEAFGGFQRIKIAERNGVLFDLRNPLSAFHFATFLVRLKHEHGRMLRERMDEQALARLRERLEKGEWETRWTMSHYIEEQEKTSEGDLEDVVSE